METPRRKIIPTLALLVLAAVALWVLSFVKVPANTIVYQPPPNRIKDMFYSSVFDYGSGHIIDNEKLRVGGWADDYWTLIQFDLSDLPKHAKHVELQMTLYDEEGTSTPMDILAIATPWDEIAGWTGELGTGNYAASVEAPQREGVFTLDITSLYNQWQSGALPNYGIVMQPLENDHQFNTFRSSEYAGSRSKTPFLRITVK